MEELAFIERLQSELGSKNIACSIAFFFAMFNEEKGDFDLSYSKNFIRTKNGKFKEEDTSSFNIKFEKEFEEYLRRKRLPEKVIKSALKKRFGFLRIFYLPPKYLKEPVCLISGKAKKFPDVRCFEFPEDIEDFRNQVEKFLKWLGFEENFDKYKEEDFEYVYFYYTIKLREWLEIKSNEVLYIYHIPFFKELGVGGIEFAINECLMREQVEEIRRLALPFFIDRLSLEIYRYEKFNLTRYALRSAVAAIMIRNFTHHHGSHVIPRLTKNELQNNPDGVEKYLQYINEKTALLNIINVYDPICEGKVNLKNALEYLQTVEGYKKADEGVKLFVNFFAKASGRELVIIDKPECDDELIVSPGYGEIGVHAIYIIFENYVRNVLKHCKPPSKNKERGPTIKFSVKKENKFARVWIKSNYVVDNSGDIVRKINNIIENSKIIDEQGKTDFENPGIKEMRICANMLIGRTLGLAGGELKAIKDGNGISYEFKIPLAKYVSEGDKNTIERIKAGKEVKPDFLVVNPSDSFFILQNWSVLPQRICWIGKEENLQLDDKWKKWLNWIKRRSIFIEEDEYSKCKNEQEKYCLLLEKWWDKIFKDRGIEIKFCEVCENSQKKGWQMEYWRKIEQLIDCKKSNNLEFHFCHPRECNHKNVRKLTFSHDPTYRICRYFGRKEENCYLKNADDCKKKIVGLEICSILAFKILIIDNELYDKFQGSLKDLEKINIFIIPENKDSFPDLKNYDCVVFHLGMLDVRQDLYEIEPDNLPPYVRIVTGRARPLSHDILQKCLWANSRLIDRSVFMRGLEPDDLFEKKYRVFWGVLK